MLRRSVVKILLLSVTFSITRDRRRSRFCESDGCSKETTEVRRSEAGRKSAASQIRHTRKFSLKTSQRIFDLQLVPHDLRSSDYRSQVIGSDGVARELPRNPVNTYKGFVSGMKSTQVRLTITNDSIEGAILTANGHYFIQPARSLSKTARKDEFIFYNSEDVTYDPDMRSLTLADQVAVEQERARAYVDKSTGQITSTNIVAPSPPRTQVMEFTVDPNSRVAGRRAFLLIGASLGGQMGGLSIPITQSGSGPDCPPTPIAFGETINGALSNTDCRSPTSGADFDFADRYVFNATAGQEVVVLASIDGNFTSYVTLIGPTGRILLTGVLAEFFHTRIPGGKGTLKLGLAGQYVIEVTGALPGISGPYTLTLLNDAPPTLLAEESSDNAIALQSGSVLRGPFPLTTPFNLSPDQHTRLMLIADNLAVLPGENQSAVTAIAEDSQLNAYPLTVEFFGKVPGFGRLTQIVAKLPPNLPPGQELQVKVTVRGKTSNKVRFRIKSP